MSPHVDTLWPSLGIRESQVQFFLIKEMGAPKEEASESIVNKSNGKEAWDDHCKKGS
jgi:hypothetical protein